MYYYEVAPTKIVRIGSNVFTYESRTVLSVGQIVKVELGSLFVVGVVVRSAVKPQYATKEITELLPLPPLPEAIVALSLWLSDYYSTPLATVLQTVLPRGLEITRRQRALVPQSSVRARTETTPTDEQTVAINTIRNMSPGSALLHGVTGSGKTNVYIELAKHSIANGKSVIILVPEIALTSQLLDEFLGVFSDIIVTHSRQTEAERHVAWLAALTSEIPRVAIGPRSALFLPFKQLGLIAIDEAHEPSFKQEQAPRYSALRTASILASSHSAKVVLGSATPAVSDYYLAEHSGRPIVRLTKPARPQAAKPDIALIDMTKRTHFKKHRFLSDTLLTRMQETLAEGRQVLLFHNRRGSASTTLCEHCGWSATCSRCFVPLTLHTDKHHLRCHACGTTYNIPTSCPECGEADIIHKDIGTKLIESEVRALFKEYTIARFDGDNDTGQSVDTQYKALYSGEIRIIIGTQVIAKGFDLPRLGMVGIIQADAGLNLPDYGASERTFQLLAQAIGRVGRSSQASSVVVQSYQPTHPAVRLGLAQDYDAFYQFTLEERRRAHFPPFSYLLKLVCVYKTEKAAITNAKKLAAELRAHIAGTGVTLLGPTPAFYERQHDTYRWQIIVKSSKRADLIRLLTHLPQSHWQYELDPISLL